jgi:hypothetical protein
MCFPVGSPSDLAASLKAMDYRELIKMIEVGRYNHERQYEPVAASCMKKARRLMQKHDDFRTTLAENHPKVFATLEVMERIYDVPR